MMDDVSKIRHLYWRAGFGVIPGQHKNPERHTYSKALDELFQEAEKVVPLDFIKEKRTKEDFRKLTAAKRKALRKEERQRVRGLNVHWIERMSADRPGIFREKMTLFWHGHFAASTDHSWKAQQLNNVIRTYALGNFRELLLAVSRSPNMLDYLNNKQNRRQKPNENFARELMELFTLGRDHYSEEDIHEAARAFTGWTYDNELNFEINERQHDFGEKTFFGEVGRFGGEEIVDLILSQKQAARFIAGKVYRYFVNQSPNDAQVEQLADAFYDSGYQIEALMRTLFEAPWFCSPENVGSKIKSPIELLVGLNRQFDLEWEVPDNVIFIQKLLGQILFDPPNVAGWPGGRRWLDSTTLMTRLRLPSVLLNGGVIGNEWDDALDRQTLAKAKSKLQRRVKAVGSWDEILKQCDNREQARELLLAIALSETAERAIDTVPEGDLKNYILALVSLPEYQLC